MSRVLFMDPPTVRAESEYDTWPLTLRTLWREADVTVRRRALAFRWALRRAAEPDALPTPACPLCAALRRVEGAYRAGSWCRGGKAEWER